MISPQGQKVINRVSDLLEMEEATKKFGLHIVPEATLEEDNWVYVVIQPSLDGIPAHDFVSVIDKVEKAVRADVTPSVLILPSGTGN